MFVIGYFVNIHGKDAFFININRKYRSMFINNFDINIAKTLKLSLKEYQEILKKFNATAYTNNNSEYIFEKEEDCLQCIEYLNENYGILLALMER